MTEYLWYIYRIVVVIVFILAFLFMAGGLNFKQIFTRSFWFNFWDSDIKLKTLAASVLCAVFWPAELAFFIGVIIHLAILPRDRPPSSLPPEERDSIIFTPEIDTPGII